MKITIVGIPSHAGALYSGTELAPQALRAAGLGTVLEQGGIEVVDLGDIALLGCMPRHNVPPVRNWPAPRMIWETIMEQAPGWFTEHAFTLILGGDCSIIAGTVAGMRKVYGENTYIIVIDGHLDTIKPQADRCVGAAGMGLWFLTQDDHVWWHAGDFPVSRVQVLGCQTEPEESYGIQVYSLDHLQNNGISQTLTEMLEKLPNDAKILVHFDVDVLHKEAMSAAYSPSDKGLSLKDGERLLERVLADQRVVGLEITEFSGLRDPKGDQAERLVELVANALGKRGK